MPNVFAYGTLMFPEVGGPVADLTGWGEPVTLPGYARYKVARLNRAAGFYPGIVPEAGSNVHGLLFRNITDDQLAALDEFEQIDQGWYVREHREFLTGSGPCQAHVYVARLPLIDSESAPAPACPPPCRPIAPPLGKAIPRSRMKVSLPEPPVRF